MFRHRIKDLLIVNAVLAIALGIAISLGRYLYQVGLMLAIILVTVVGPVIWVETYLYRKKHGIWYRSRNPRKPRPRYVPLTDLPPYFPPESGAAEPQSNGRSRTRLFQTGSSSEPVSRASLLFKVAQQLETSGRIDAAVEIYRQILDHFENASEAREAAHRLHALSGTKTPVDR
jgi:hypothetical protein